ncbi:MAG: hypothetical protein CM15mP42_03290 [Methanobacteriota archaeon]|nr:MAG: hypothetical protein CM15mP42_03290 [Euryarchaeota archaeon]
MYFRANDGSNGIELWVSDGSSVGTKWLKIYVQEAHPLILMTFVASDKFVYFRVFDDSTGWEPWKSDGTEEGTELVKDIRPGNKL